LVIFIAASMRNQGFSIGNSAISLTGKPWLAQVGCKWEKRRGARIDAVEQRHQQLEQFASPAALLGYLNFSDGKPDPRWQKLVNESFAYYAQTEPAPWLALLEGLRLHLRQLERGEGSAFKDVAQANAVLARAGEVLTAYRKHHADLLSHLTDSEIFGPFFLVRVFEAILSLGIKTPDEGVLARLNDFVGHRPIAVLETRPQGEPYDHERHRPLPLFLQGAGVAVGRYQDVVQQALDILKATDPALLQEASFDLDLLEELAVDLRAYDHAHPVNRRPNYVFGEWDPHHIDGQGRYRRYVVRKITLDALLDRVEQPSTLDRGERLAEAAAVLAGTILMAAGVSGWGPGAHDSGATLATLLPRVARNRDAFYEHLLGRLEGEHANRLKQEQTTTRQPFGAARQHLNAFLARHRAAQLQQRHLTLLFAEMGYPDASREEAARIPAVSARLLSETLGRLAAGQTAIERGQLGDAGSHLPAIVELLKRGIACGAFADPWNALGFQALFPLSPAREDSVRDVRLDELVQIVEQTFHLYARLMSEAAAAGDFAQARDLGEGLQACAGWWDQFATFEVADLRHVNGGDAIAAGQSVAAALAGWHQRGETAADLAFWRDRLDAFTTPKAFALVVDTLLHKRDFRAAAGLLSCWLGQAELVPLEDGLSSFHHAALRWILTLVGAGPNEGRHDLLARFFASLEANAEEYWQVPALELLGPPLEIDENEEEDEDEGGDDEDEEEAREEDLYGAAYDDMTYQDTTNDDEGDVSDGAPLDAFDLEEDNQRLETRLRFLATLARLWQVAARALTPRDKGNKTKTKDQKPFVADWLGNARANLDQLRELLDVVEEQEVPEPTGEHESLVEYDRRRVLKEHLLHTTIGAALDTALAVGALRGAMGNGSETAGGPDWEEDAVCLERALFAGDPDRARDALRPFMTKFREETLLFTALSEGGDPRSVLEVRIAQTVLRGLLANLPRLGLLRETHELLRTARAMEQARPAQGKGVTEFNQYFQAGYQAVVESVVVSSSTWASDQGGDAALIEMMERLTGPFLALWIEHSRSLQLSVLEGLASESAWQALRGFVKRYGGDLFHARFLTLANLRGILHRGVGAYLDQLQENPDPLRPIRLLDDLNKKTIRREDAVRRLEIVLQAVVENYEEYKDYNTTTTQSDYGENLHVLLDFLRLKAGYERHAWQVRPLVLAHEMLARRGRTGAAVRWERSLIQFTRELAAQHVEQLTRIERAHGMRLGTVSDRINERFVKPLALDRLCALVEPSLREAREGAPASSFTRLRAELPAYTSIPTGVGLDVPAWLRRLEAEVHKTKATQTTVATLAETFFRVPRRSLTFDEVQAQLGDWDRPSLPPG
jgi:hypothetical protein